MGSRSYNWIVFRIRAETNHVFVGLVYLFLWLTENEFITQVGIQTRVHLLASQGPSPRSHKRGNR